MGAPMVRLAVLRFGEEWSVQTKDRRIGHFPLESLAIQAGARFAREASGGGEQVELLVQDAFGRLAPFTEAAPTDVD